jgi:hypothetical protein
MNSEFKVMSGLQNIETKQIMYVTVHYESGVKFQIVTEIFFELFELFINFKVGYQSISPDMRCTGTLTIS